jgi:hypothetical protein
VVGTWGGDAFGVAVWCVFPSGEYEDDGAGGVRGCGVGGVDCVFLGTSHAFVVVFHVSDVSAAPCAWGVTADGREVYVFWVE